MQWVITFPFVELEAVELVNHIPASYPGIILLSCLETESRGLRETIRLYGVYLSVIPLGLFSHTGQSVKTTIPHTFAVLNVYKTDGITSLQTYNDLRLCILYTLIIPETYILGTTRG